MKHVRRCPKCGGTDIIRCTTAVDGAYDIVNAVEKELKLLFNRRTMGPPPRGAHSRFRPCADSRFAARTAAKAAVR